MKEVVVKVVILGIFLRANQTADTLDMKYKLSKISKEWAHIKSRFSLGSRGSRRRIKEKKLSTFFSLKSVYWAPNVYDMISDLKGTHNHLGKQDPNGEWEQYNNTQYGITNLPVLKMWPWKKQSSDRLMNLSLDNRDQDWNPNSAVIVQLRAD